MVSRAEPSLSGRWWWSIDRLILTALVALMISGVVLLMAGGPPVAERLGLSTFHFVNRQAAYLVGALVIFLGVSLMTPRQVRRAALLIYLGSLVMVVATLYFGVEVKGAKRWLTLGPLGSVQPSEFLKPAFVVMAAWAFAEGLRRPDLPGTILALLAGGDLGVLVVPQADRVLAGRILGDGHGLSFRCRDGCGVQLLSWTRQCVSGAASAFDRQHASDLRCRGRSRAADPHRRWRETSCATVDRKR